MSKENENSNERTDEMVITIRGLEDNQPASI